MIARLLLISSIALSFVGCSRLSSLNDSLDRDIAKLVADNKKLSAANAALIRDKKISDKLMLDASKELSGKDLEIMKLKNKPPEVRYLTSYQYVRDNSEEKKLNDRIDTMKGHIRKGIGFVKDGGKCYDDNNGYYDAADCIAEKSNEYFNKALEV